MIPNSKSGLSGIDSRILSILPSQLNKAILILVTHIKRDEILNLFISLSIRYDIIYTK